MESVPNSFPHLFLGYSLIWGLIIIYVVLTFRRLNRLEKIIRSKEDRRDNH